MVRGRLTGIPATSRPDRLRPEIWPGLSEAAQRREEQQWAVEKRKLDNARKLRGINFIDPDGQEFQRNHYKRADNAGIAMEAAMPCKVRKLAHGEAYSESKTNIRKSKHASILEAHESTRKGLERTLPKDHEDRIAGKGFN